MSALVSTLHQRWEEEEEDGGESKNVKIIEK